MELLGGGPQRDTVVALGKFDGVHVGHIRLLQETAAIAKKKALYALAFTFRVPGRDVLMTDQEKVAVLSRYGMNGVHFEDLTDTFMQLTPGQFLEEVLLQRWRAKHIVVGFNYRFGHGRSGDAALLLRLCEERQIGLTVIDPVMQGGSVVSSTRVRQAVGAGDMEQAGQLLGRPYAVAGEVMPGKRLGREIGFPTVNLYPDVHLVLPQRGVYVTELLCEGRRYAGMTNVGFNPTVEHIRHPKVETHVFDFHRDLYGKQVRVEFFQKIREEKAFAGVQELKGQLERDVQIAKAYWKKGGW